MKRRKKTIMLFMLLVIMLSLQGCGVFDIFEELFDPNLMIIRGPKTISGENNVLEIAPGTRVLFKESGKFLFSEGYANRGELIFKDGAKLIANGEAERIIFDATNCNADIIFEENASNDSIVKYCEFKYLSILIRNDTTINYNKFQQSVVICYVNSSPHIEYNTFDGGEYSDSDGICSSQLASDPEPTTTPTIINNIFVHCYNSISFRVTDTPVIEFNNITYGHLYAVGWISGTINNNYISDCNGKTGVDTIGEQSGGVTYQNPQTSPIAEAGCGW